MTKQSDIEMVAKARACAVKAHAGQKDKAGQDYFKAHVTVVAEGVKGDPIAEAVAFLHDTVEDTSVTIEDIRTGFPKEKHKSKGWTNAMPKTNEAKKATCTNVRTA